MLIGVLKENVKCSHKTIDYFRCIEAKMDTFCEDASESIRCCMKTAYDVISFILQVVRSDSQEVLLTASAYELSTNVLNRLPGCD